MIGAFVATTNRHDKPTSRCAAAFRRTAPTGESIVHDFPYSTRVVCAEDAARYEVASPRERLRTL